MARHVFLITREELAPRQRSAAMVADACGSMAVSSQLASRAISVRGTDVSSAKVAGRCEEKRCTMTTRSRTYRELVGMGLVVLHKASDDLAKTSAAVALYLR